MGGCGHYSPCDVVNIQASALRLKHEVREREAAVERAYLRLQTGQPPDEATEQQWQQYLREEQRRREASIAKKVRELETCPVIISALITTVGCTWREARRRVHC